MLPAIFTPPWAFRLARASAAVSTLFESSCTAAVALTIISALMSISPLPPVPASIAKFASAEVSHRQSPSPFAWTLMVARVSSVLSILPLAIKAASAVSPPMAWMSAPTPSLFRSVNLMSVAEAIMMVPPSSPGAKASASMMPSRFTVCSSSTFLAMLAVI